MPYKLVNVDALKSGDIVYLRRMDDGRMTPFELHKDSGLGHGPHKLWNPLGPSFIDLCSDNMAYVKHDGNGFDLSGAL